MEISAVAVAQMPEIANQIGKSSLNLEKELSSPDSSLSLAIGVSEGNRSADGDYLAGYYGHTDYGNGKQNQGTFSRNGQAFATPQDADLDWLEQMRQVLPQYEKAATAAGLDPKDPILAGNFFDLYTQSPAAATAEGGFLDQLPTIAAEGGSEESILDARVSAYYEPQTGKLDASGFGNNLERLTADQSRRMGAISSTMHELGKADASGDIATPATTNGETSRPAESMNSPLQDSLLEQLEKTETIRWKDAPSIDDVRNGGVLSKGHAGPSVQSLQEMLNRAGADISADGYFGNETVKAVDSFQRENGLVAPKGMEGMVGPTTLSAIEAAGGKSETGEVVYYSQNLNQHEPSGTCANTSMAMMMDTFGIHDDSVQRTPDYLYDTHGKVQDVEGMADVFNYEAKQADSPVRATSTRTADLNHLRESAKAGEASVVGGYFTPNPGHFVVVTGYDEQTDSYIVNDPRGVWNEQYNGTHDTSQSGNGIKYPAAAFEDAVAPDGNVWMIEFDQ